MMFDMDILRKRIFLVFIAVLATVIRAEAAPKEGLPILNDKGSLSAGITSFIDRIEKKSATKLIDLLFVVDVEDTVQ